MALLKTSDPILVFGGSGFTGVHLLNHLRRLGTPILSPSRQEFDLVKASKDEILVYLSKTKPSIVVNLAGLSHVQGSDIEDYYSVNAFAVLKFLEVARNVNSIKRVILASTANLYGNTHGAAKENDPSAINPLNHYGLSKLLLEKMVGLNEGYPFETCFTRPFSCIGVGQKKSFLVPKIVSHFLNREMELELGNTHVRRDFVDIRDAALTYASMILHEKPLPKVVNICSNLTYSIQDLIEMIARITKHQLSVRSKADFVRSNDITFQQGDNHRLAFELGIKFKYSIEETLQWMCENEESK